MNSIQKIYNYLFALFCASFPFTDLAKAIPNILMGVLGVLFFFLIKKEDFKKLRLKSLNLFVLMIFVGFFSMLIFQRWDDMSFIIRLLTIIVIILISLPVKDLKTPIKTFVISSLSLLIISSFKLILYAKNSSFFDFTLGKHINDLLLGERPYLGMLYVTSACLCWYLASKTSLFSKYLWYIISVIFVGFVFVISARMALISFFIIVFVNLFYHNKRLKMALTLASGIMVLAILLFSFNENIKKRFFISDVNHTVSEKLAFEPRYHIWECAISLEQNTNSILFGKGFKNTEDELVNCYKAKEKFYTEEQQQWFIAKRFNSHNQYLGIYYSMGVIALVGFIGFLYYALYENRKSYYAMSLLLLLSLFFITENLIYRQIGITYIGLSLVFAWFINRENAK